ncbi:uncharacterized protein LOC107846788 [Capsicum annuum]|uniref:uncharacterized protein LOC107846788 n=1 Tax=Capsicum annuum TaxID=4072 RepID=UPI001FB0806B|nr:uncharacterized protein LOC107846788 [Capsicum annuum]
MDDDVACPCSLFCKGGMLGGIPLEERPDIQDLKRLIPKQYELKGECNIDLLSNRHVLIRVSQLEDYIHLLSKPTFYINHRDWSYEIRTLKWDPMFNSGEKTTTTIAWISFPSLPPNLFGKETVFPLALAVERPLQVDLAMKNQTRPSYARVKVEVDLLGEFPTCINVGVKKQNKEVSEKWITIKYDYVPKYCKTFMIQGHNEQQCYMEHPELYPKKEEAENQKGKEEANNNEEDNKQQETKDSKKEENGEQ